MAHQSASRVSYDPSVLYLEDLVVGSVTDLGSVVVDRDELIAFAERFDPQLMHTDEAAAARSPFGGLIASGWHTGSMWMRLYVDTVVRDVANLGGLGIDKLQFPAPVRPGDILTGAAEVLEARVSPRKADRGTMVVLGTMHNQHGELVFSLRSATRVARRPQPASG
jgi:acyl dehydratase